MPWADLNDPKGSLVAENRPTSIDKKSLSNFTFLELLELQECMASDKPVKFVKRVG